MKLRHCISAVLLGAAAAAAQAEPLRAIGWIEDVNVQPHKLTLQAKIDTGADNSSVHAEDIVIFERDGVKMVRFVISNKNGERLELEKPLVRIANIKRRGMSEPMKRPVVKLDLCIGETIKTAEINLANRTNFKYRMLIGRSYLKDLYLVDSNRKHTAKPTCDGGDSLAQYEG